MNTQNETRSAKQRVLHFIFIFFLVAMTKGLLIYSLRDHNKRRQAELMPNDFIVLSNYVRALDLQNSASADVDSLFLNPAEP